MPFFKLAGATQLSGAISCHPQSAGMCRVDRAACEAGLQRLVVAGTCEYGLQNGSLTEDQFTDPVNCYAMPKTACDV